MAFVRCVFSVIVAFMTFFGDEASGTDDGECGDGCG
jgi:hypothetical protein